MKLYIRNSKKEIIKKNKMTKTIIIQGKKSSKKGKIFRNKKKKKNVNISSAILQNNNGKTIFNSKLTQKIIIQNKKEMITKPETCNLNPDTDYELNWLIYEQAIKYDKRSNCEYYGSLIKGKQLFIFTFCSFNDYNSGVIKKFMFFLSFALNYNTNALFFDESTMHQIYEDEGKFNFTYQISKIIFSAIISTLILRLILQFLVLTDKDILEVKYQQTKDKALNMKIIKLKCMKIKFTIFFVLNFILLGLFWHYLTCFNAVYKNTQTYLIENTFISFGFSLIYPFIINIFPTLIRMSSIRSSNKDQMHLYKMSQIIQVM